MTTAFTGADAVVSCLGVRTSARALLRPVTFQQRMLPTVLAAINDARVPRFVPMSSFGIADTRGKASFLPRVVYGAVAKNLFEDKALAETALDGCQANWTAVYPVSLRNGPVALGWDLLPLDRCTQCPACPCSLSTPLPRC